MKNLLLLPLLAAILLLFTGCPYGHRYEEGKFPYDPVNFTEANSPYDDFNMSSPVIEGQRFLYFSSNRQSGGGQFDIVGQHFHLLWDKEDGKLTIDDQPASWKNYYYADSLFSLANSPSNEYGPYSLFWVAYESSDLNDYYNDLLIYASDETGDLDLSLVYFKGPEMYPQTEEGEYTGPEPVAMFNSEHNDAYLTFYGQGFVTDDWGAYPQYITEALFCSDRNGDFDIYQSAVPPYSNMVDYLLSDGTAEIIQVEAVNSGSQDKCPYVNGDLLIFASDRPGGYGGFDLYYSLRSGDGWSQPENFGSRINTEYNEYRPIAFTYWEFQNDIMLFSSDRPGGQGGYDLYYVGISKMMMQYLEELKDVAK
jgi:hypothetical protein